jgi:uncharacterized damage-inducible protein DinB
MPNDLANAFLERSIYYLGVEYPAKIRAAVLTIPDDRIWWRANERANSAGNLLLHLAGNVRQWIVSGVGGAPDVRQRDTEFAATHATGPARAALLDDLDAACAEAVQVLRSLTAASLHEARQIQGRETTVFSAVYHVVEHFSGHTGQLILIAKWLTPGSVQFYDDRDGLARPLFLDGRSDMGGA